MPHGLVSRVSLGLSAQSARACLRGMAPRALRCAKAVRVAASRAAGRARRSPRATAAGPRQTTRKLRIAAVDALESRELLSATFFVATNGSDNNAGTINSPFLTIQHAASLAGPGDTIDIRGGTYHETVTPASSGAPGAPITYQAYNGEDVVIDGADSVTGWSNYSGSIYEANDPADLGFGNNQVFVNGQAINQATWPNIGLDLSHPRLATVQGGGGSLTDNALLSSGVDWTGGVIHIVSGEAWVSQTATITSDSGNRITFNLGATYDPHGGIQPGDKYYLTGKLSALDSPGQFFLGSGGSLYVWTPNSSDPNSDNVQVKRRLYGFDLDNRSNINIDGINLFACTIVANASNSIHINGITAEYLSQFTLDSDGWQPGNDTGIVLNGSNDSLTNSVIAYSAGDGVLALGYGNTIENNVIHDCDYSATDTAGIRTWGGDDTIDNNTIYNCGRDGIKFSYTTGTQVEHNLIHDVMLQTTDGGGIYTYGTNGAGSQIAYNKCFNIHSGGWGAAGLYLDNGSSNFSVHNNYVSNVDIGLKANPTSYNERIVDNTLLGDQDSIGSSGSQDMSGSQFIGNVFDAPLMIKGSVEMSGNVSSGDTAGIFAAGASIGDSIISVPTISSKTVAPAQGSTVTTTVPPSGGAATSTTPPPTPSTPPTTPVTTPTVSSKVATTTPATKAVTSSPTPAVAAPSPSEPLVGPFKLIISAKVAPAVTTAATPAQMMQAAQNQLAADRESFLDAIAAVKSWAQGTVSADIKSIAAEKTQIRRDRNASSALAADRIALAADQSKLHADIKAQAARVAQDKPGFFAQLRADLRQWRLFRRLLKIKTRK